MCKLVRICFVGAVLASAGLAAIIAWPIGRSLEPISLVGNVDQGAYLARASDCIACHTDFAQGGAPLAGGVALETPFGTLYSPNLTTDPDYGIGGWTMAQFARAVRQGVSPTGEPYYPAFIYPFYANFSDQDIADLWAAFQTVPPVATPSPDHEMTFPFDQRWGLKLWRAAFLEPPRNDLIPGKEDVWNRGRELVEGATHCAACHTGETSQAHANLTLNTSWAARPCPAATRRRQSTSKHCGHAVGTQVALQMPCARASPPKATPLGARWARWFSMAPASSVKRTGRPSRPPSWTTMREGEAVTNFYERNQRT